MAIEPTEATEEIRYYLSLFVLIIIALVAYVAGTYAINALQSIGVGDLTIYTKGRLLITLSTILTMFLAISALLLRIIEKLWAW